MARKRIELDVDRIISLYRDDMLSSIEIADCLETTEYTILRRLRENNIPRRNRSESRTLKDGVIMGGNTYRNPDWLYYQYRILEKSQAEIAEKAGIRQSVISHWMKAHNIPPRSIIETAKLHVNHFAVTDDFNDFITGLLLGDGCLQSVSTISAHYTHGSKHRPYIKDLKKRFKSFSIQAPAQIYPNERINKGRKYTVYLFDTLSYAELLPIQQKWYPNGKKTLPADIELNPTVCLHWYLGDGELRNSEGKRGRPDICLATCCFTKKEVLRLIGKLGELGISASYWPSCNCIGIGVDNTPKFLDLIGPCPDGVFSSYGYRFDVTRSKKQWETKFAVS